MTLRSTQPGLRGSAGRLFRQFNHTGAPLRSRNTVVPKAAYNPGLSGASQEPPRFHGVLHSTDLPAMLAESVGIYDARDAIETCSGLWGEEKEACYAIFGVDPSAEAWFDVVFSLENALELETGPEEEAFHHGQERV